MSSSVPTARETSSQNTSPIEVPQRPASPPMYVASFVVTYCGLWAAAFVLNDPSFMLLVTSLTVIGFVASYICRVQNVPARNIEMPALILCIFVLALSFVGDPGTAFLAPSGAGEDRMRSLAVLLTWLTVFRSFTLISDGSLMFACVPTIALIGLVGTSNSDSQLILDFVVFVFASIFLVVHENMRTSEGQVSVQSVKSSSNLWMSAQVALTVLCVLASMFTANFISPIVHQIGYYVRLSGGLPAAQSTAITAPGKTTLADNRPEVSDGTGPIKASNEVVMKVRASEAQYWRSSTYNTYTGKAWSRPSGSSSSLNPAMRPAAPPVTQDQLLDGGNYFETRPIPDTRIAVNSKRLTQRFKRVSGVVKEINGAGEIAALTARESSIVVDVNGGLSFTNIVTNAEYVIESYIPEWTPEAEKVVPGSYPASILAENLSLAAISPDSLNVIRETARKVTADKPSQFDKVHALIDWIGTQCKYNLNASVNSGSDDSATAFLFKVKEGYCDHFSTALAVMCRSINIPARVAVGYLPGELDNATKEFVIHDRDRHRWTEVYFNGVGWMTFDATSAATDITEETGAADKQNKGFWATFFKKGIVPPLILGVVVILGLYVLKVELLDKLIKNRITKNPLGIPPTNYAIVQVYQTLEKQLGKLRLMRQMGETVCEFMNRLTETLELTQGSKSSISGLLNLFQDYRYGDIVASTSDVANAKAFAETVSVELKSRSKIFTQQIKLAESNNG